MQSMNTRIEIDVLENNMAQIVLATSNKHKLEEINAIAEKFNISFSKVDDDFNPIEDGKNFEENAYIKAFEAAKLTNKIAFADDTGLCVEALDGRPGIYSARYAPTQEEKISKLLEEMKAVPQEKRNAYFICTMVAVDSSGKILYKTTGKIDGFIVNSPSGANGFGYDPIFYIPKLNKTMAELTTDEKNTVSHRALALIPMIEYLRAL